MSVIINNDNADIENRDNMNIVIVGHVDHGKSTVIGRMLADTNSLPEGKIEQVKENCRRNSKPFEYAFLLDALKDEQAQGITIDAARCFFKTDKRNYIIIDAPGHIEFLKNMVTGAARAEAALLVIDANEGVMENSNRHGYLISMLGIRQVAIIVNKMDLVDYSQDVFNGIVEKFSEFLNKIDVEPSAFIPVSGILGDNVAFSGSDKMPWYDGDTVLQQLDNFKSEKEPENLPFRMPVQGVYKFTRNRDDRRIIAGTVDTGQLRVGDDVTFYPSGKTSKVKSIEAFNADIPEFMEAGQAYGFTLEDQIYIVRGEMVSKSKERKPEVARRIKTNLFWLGREPLVMNKDYYIKLGSAKVPARLEKVIRVLDASNLNNTIRDQVERHEVAECIFMLSKPIAFDLMENVAPTSRFVLVDEYEISGGGIITGSMDDEHSWVRRSVIQRNIKWEKSIISREKRAEKLSQKPALVFITGSEDCGKKPLAKVLEKKLFDEGRMVYFLGIGNVLYGVDADIKKPDGNHHEEHLRRLGEVANLILDTGVILIVTAVELTANDMDIINTTVNPDVTEVIWIGDDVTTDIKVSYKITDNTDLDKNAYEIKRLLQKNGVIFNPFG